MPSYKQIRMRWKTIVSFRDKQHDLIEIKFLISLRRYYGPSVPGTGVPGSPRC